WHLLGGRGEQVLGLDRYPLPLPAQFAAAIGSRRCPPSFPPCSLLEHMTGPRRLQDHS
ncbi:unnamed protein product, partial [Staurois parvus]